MQVLFAAGLLAVSVPAHASSVFERDRNWIVDLQFGGYSPRVDRELAGATPFKDTFGNKNRVLSQLGLQRLVFKDFGTLGIGANVGYSEFFGHGFISGTDVQSADTTHLQIVPITGFVSYRLDYPAVEWNIPFVPYGRAGIGAWIFWVSNGGGETSDDGKAKGVRWGWTASAGLQFMLDFFDPRLSAEFYREWGVAHTYVYVDWTHSKVTSFGRRGLDLSDDMWSGGIAFEF
ncbi:hypothetical protein AKJ08_1742 [Vulgatibacter incomptus]|uniref:Outer membrane protein beta-barrel domain-containing protein n=1 Tax=Vulgatibacter incomptus TaxID=1391653 RepID=A0A0K1PCV6_9BACT|nr:hypothetical protein AKJ08_1742 [Vulgatibacter incomptus]